MDLLDEVIIGVGTFVFLTCTVTSAGIIKMVFFPKKEGRMTGDGGARPKRK